MPFPRQIRSVSRSAKTIRDCDDMPIQLCVISGLAAMFRWQRFRHVPNARKMVIDSGLEHCARRRARSGDVEIGEAHAMGSQRVDIRCGDFAAECADVGEAPVVSDHDHDIRSRSNRCGRRGNQYCGNDSSDFHGSCRVEIEWPAVGKRTTSAACMIRSTARVTRLPACHRLDDVPMSRREITIPRPPRQQRASTIPRFSTITEHCCSLPGRLPSAPLYWHYPCRIVSLQ